MHLKVKQNARSYIYHVMTKYPILIDEELNNRYYSCNIPITTTSR